MSDEGGDLPTFEERLRMLLDFGLTEYQARVYLALLSLGTAIASQVPQLSKVPRTRIYSTMHQLHEKGLVQIIPETPIKYQAVPFDSFLTRQIEGIRTKAERLEQSKEAITRVFAAVQHQEASSQGRFEVVYGRRNVRDRVSKIYHAATKELIVVGTVTSPDRIAKAMLFSIEDKHEEGIKFRFLFPGVVKNPQRLEVLQPYAQIRFIPLNLPVFFLIVDGEQALINHPIPNDENHVRGDDVALWTDDEGFVEGLQLIAEDLWAMGASTGQEALLSPLLRLVRQAVGQDGKGLAAASEPLAKALGAVAAAGATGSDPDAAAAALRGLLEGAGLGTAVISNDKPLEVTLQLKAANLTVPEGGLEASFMRALTAATFSSVCKVVPAKVVIRQQREPKP